MKTFFRVLLSSSILLACLGSNPSNAQTTEQHGSAPKELYDAIAHMDSVLFNAFNGHDMETLKKIFTEDLEFYHDNGGLSNYSQNMDAFAKTIAKNTDLKRELIAGSLEVYPIKDYGAIQVGMHRFCHTENGKPDCGVFKFIHIWKKINNEWKISRVISYDH